MNVNADQTLQPPYNHIVQALKEQRYTDAEREAAREIRKAPLLPQPWVLLAEALMHQGFGNTARRAFDRAWLLDPEATWAQGAFKALEKVPAGTERLDIELLLHYERVTVAVGIIARNEERCIARCLDSIHDIADEILLIDCASTDRTAEIASSYAKVRIIPAVWNDSFSELRNLGLSHMNSDWVLWIDADEYLEKADQEAVHTVAGIYHPLAIPPVLCVWHVNHTQGTQKHDLSLPRMFPLNRGLRYHGRVHEQIGPSEGDLFSSRLLRKPVRIRLHHDGYEPSIVQSKSKLERNLKLLRMMVDEEPSNPGWWLYYGRESLFSGEAEQALEALLKAEEAAQNKPSFARLPHVWMLMAQIYASKSDWTAVITVCEKTLDHSPGFPDAQFYMALAKMKQGFALYKEAEGLLQEAKTSFRSYRGTVSPDHEIGKWKADVALADLLRSSGRFGDAAGIYYRVADRYPYAKSVRKPIKLMKEQLEKLRKLKPFEDNME